MQSTTQGRVASLHVITLTKRAKILNGRRFDRQRRYFFSFQFINFFVYLFFNPEYVWRDGLFAELQEAGWNPSNEEEKSAQRGLRVPRLGRLRQSGTKGLVPGMLATLLPGAALQHPEPLRRWVKTEEPVRQHWEHVQSEKETGDLQRRRKSRSDRQREGGESNPEGASRRRGWRVIKDRLARSFAPERQAGCGREAGKTPQFKQGCFFFVFVFFCFVFKLTYIFVLFLGAE